MAIVAISGCEKDPIDIPIEALQPGDTYEDGIIVYIDTHIKVIELMSMEDLGEFVIADVAPAAEAFKSGKSPDWHIPNFGDMQHIIGFLDLGVEKWYWFQDPDNPLYLMDADFGNNGLHPPRTDDGQPHWLRMHRKIYF